MTRVHVHAACWNDRRMLPFFVRHYAFAERIVVYDDGSVDGSIEYLAGCPRVEVRRVERTGAATLDRLHRVQDQCWKSSRGEADWVLVVDVDEHVYHERVLEYLDWCRRSGITIVPAVGYQMVADSFPGEEERLWETVRRGVLFDEEHKPAFFDPGAIDEVNFIPGRHRATPTGRVRYPPVDEVRLLHFKYLGLEYVQSRSAQLTAGLEPLDIERRHGIQWTRPNDGIERDFALLREIARDVDLAAPMGLEGWAFRWWRGQTPWYVRGWQQRQYRRALETRKSHPE